MRLKGRLARLEHALWPHPRKSLSLWTDAELLTYQAWFARHNPESYATLKAMSDEELKALAAELGI